MYNEGVRTITDIPLLKPQDRAAIADAARILRSSLPVEELIVFGSKARGDDGEDSDIDLLAITSTAVNGKLKEQVLDVLFSIQRQSGVLFSPICVSRADWEGLWLAMPLRDNILREGALA